MPAPRIDQQTLTHWMGTPRAAGLVAGSWCWATASLALHGASPSAPVGTELLHWLASDGRGPELVPVAVAVLVVLLHAMLIREAKGACCREWIDAAWSLVLVAAGVGAWTWALHYEPFADPFSPARRLAAIAGLGALLVGSAMTLAAAAAAELRSTEAARPARALRRSYEAIG
jgi:hypothetical protein